MSGDVFEFEDKAKVERLIGTLHDPGATTGDVLTVQADKSIAAQPGGGSLEYAAISVIGAGGIAPFADVPFDTVVSDAGGYYDATNKQFVIPAGKGGTFLVGATADESSDGVPTACAATITFAVASNVFSALALVAGAEYAGTLAGVVALTDGDTVNLTLVPNGGATAMTVTASLWLLRLGTT